MSHRQKTRLIGRLSDAGVMSPDTAAGFASLQSVCVCFIHFLCRISYMSELEPRPAAASTNQSPGS